MIDGDADELGCADDDLGSSVVGADTPAPSNASEPSAGSLSGDEQTRAMDWEGY
jgi:hypothetical protein